MMKKAVFGFLELCVHVLAYAIVIFVIFKAAAFAYDFSYEVFGDPVMSKYDTQTVTITIKEGATASDIGKTLKDAGLIKYEQAFYLRVRLSDLGDKLQPGTYELSPSMSEEEMLEIMCSSSGGSSE